MTEPSIARRYFIKIAANAVVLLGNALILTVVPRTLGPEAFGNLEFCIASFTAILTFLSLDTQFAFFNWSARSSEGKAATGFYLTFLVSMFSLTLFLFLGAHFFNFSKVIWPNIVSKIVIYGFLWASVDLFFQRLLSIGDANARTQDVEFARVVQNFLRLAGVMIAYWSSILDTDSFAAITIVAIAISSLIIIFEFFRQKILTFDQFRFVKHRLLIKKFSKFAVQYSTPLLAVNLIGFICIFFDRWILQLVGGSAEQGFFGLSSRFNAMAFLFTSSLTPILLREMSKSFHEEKHDRVAELFGKIKFFFVFTALLCSFFIVNAEELSFVVAGDQFRAAGLAVMIMGFYPIHQTFGQLSDSLYYATGRTKIYATINVTANVLGLILTVIFVGDPSKFWFCLGLGSVGLALKNVLLQFVTTNITLWINVRHLKQSFFKWLQFQFQVVISLLAIALLARLLVQAAFDMKRFSTMETLAVLGLEGILYLLVFMIIQYLFPKVFGINLAPYFKMIVGKVR